MTLAPTNLSEAALSSSTRGNKASSAELIHLRTFKPCPLLEYDHRCTRSIQLGTSTNHLGARAICFLLAC